MLVYLMQHGPCLPEELDPARPLSPVGRDLVRRSARGLRALGLGFDLLVASPKLRALQTARLVAEVLAKGGTPGAEPGERQGEGPDGPVAPAAGGEVLADDAFLPLADPASGLAFLRRCADVERVFVAGHLPNLARLASRLLTSGPEVNLAFEHGGLVCVETTRGPAPGRLRLLLPAAVLHAAAG